ncbi:MAG: four helix bundle protein [Halobacteriovoraceae bacterium]|nr:four helix bundle protein [Halobacteriovoraceae bacterium]
MKNFKTYQLALEFYNECRKLKISNRVVKDQFERASLSIVLNLAEGSGRATEKDRRKFFVIAFGSLRETQCLIEMMDQPLLCKMADNLARYQYNIIKRPGVLIPD